MSGHSEFALAQFITQSIAFTKYLPPGIGSKIAGAMFVMPINRGNLENIFCLNPDFPDLRINRIIKNDVKKSGKSFNPENQGSDKEGKSLLLTATRKLI